MESGNRFLEITDWLLALSRELTVVWPEELPPESDTEAFWMAACREEMRMRHMLSAKIPALGRGLDPASLEPLEAWLLRMRIQWAVQLVDAASSKATDTDVSVEWFRDFALVRSWESEGCQGFWSHAERGGEPHPEAPRWLRDLR
jgi:hypothetical protein